jgi:hypothetical protein
MEYHCERAMGQAIPWVLPQACEDDQRSVLEINLISHHFTVREEELFKIGAVSFERLATLLYQGVEGRFEDIIFVEAGSVVVGVSTLHA